ncbi:MAG TPA: PQQ-binding-like beta-propeller repeat protein [Nannocystaceae bacterium]|nr:PQQ-binding-like beta-propeller repeat protein [Nannocystaceae bacterium]
MRARSLVFFLALVGCKKDEPPASAAPPLDRRARCEKIGDEMTKMGMLLAHGMVSGLSEGKEQLGAEEAAKLRAELDATKLELVEKCMGWPEEALGCFGTGALFNSEKCERLIAEALGEPVPPADVPAGPAQAWSFTLPGEQSILHGCDDGSVIAVVEPEGEDTQGATMLAIAGGKERWRNALPTAPWSIEPLDAQRVLVVLPRELVAIAIADGKEVWRVPMPADDAEPEPRALLREGERFTSIDSARRVLAIDPTRCAKGSCVEVVGKLAEDDPESHLRVELFGPVELARVPDGGLAIVMPDEQRMVVLDAKLGLRFAIESRAALSWAEVRNDELVIALDGEVIGIDATKCGNAGDTYAPATWPPTGKPEWLKDATVREREWDTTPSECVRWRRAVSAAEASDAPIAGFTDAMIVQSGGFLYALTSSAESWKSATKAQSFAVKHGDRIAVLGDVGGDDETTLAMMWLDPATGQHVGRTPLTMGKGELYLMDSPGIVSAGPLVVAGYERELVAFGK